MTLLLCRRFRRTWRGSTSSTDGQTCNLTGPEPLFFSDDDEPTGISSATEYTIISRSPRNSSEGQGLSNRFCRKLSRESRWPNTASRRSDRRSGASLFSSASPRSKRGSAILSVPHELGSGLMSEKGYDSDAQFISTPTHATEKAKIIDIIDGSGIFPGQFYRITEVNSSPEGEQSLGCEGKKRSETPVRLLEQEGRSPQALHGFSVCHDSKSEDGRGRNVSACPHNIDHDSVCKMNNKDNQDETSVLSTPTSCELLQIQNENDHSSPAAYCRRPSNSSGLSPSRPPVGSSTRLPSEILVTKKRGHPGVSASDQQSVHLTDLNIPHMLAFSSTSPRLLSPHQSDGLGSPTRHMKPVWDDGVLKLEAHHTKETSSYYSPTTTCASTDIHNRSASYQKTSSSSRKPETTRKRSLFRAISSNVSSRSTSTSKANGPIVDDSAIGKKSRFIEQFDVDRSVASLDSEIGNVLDSGMASPRKVSIGWMSEGRRLGYGYTLVTEDDAKSENARSSKALCIKDESIVSAHISGIMDRLNIRRWSGAIALHRSSNVSDSASCDSVKSIPLLRLANRRKIQNTTPASKEGKTLWSLKSEHSLRVAVNESPRMNEDAHDSKGTVKGIPTEYRKESQSAQGVQATDCNMKHQSCELVTQETTPNGNRTIAQKNGAQIMKLKITGSQGWHESASDDASVSLTGYITQKSVSPYRIDCSTKTKTDVLDRQPISRSEDYQASLERLESEAISDDWASMYQDCLEVLFDPK